MSSMQGKVNKLYYRYSIIYNPIMFIQAAVKSISKLKMMCPMCNEEEASVTMRPCGHVFCPG